MRGDCNNGHILSGGFVLYGYHDIPYRFDVQTEKKLWESGQEGQQNERRMSDREKERDAFDKSSCFSLLQNRTLVVSQESGAEQR